MTLTRRGTLLTVADSRRMNLGIDISPSVHHTVITTHTTLDWPHIALAVVVVALVVTLSVHLWRRTRKTADL